MNNKHCWTGHKTARRTETENGWLYQVAANQALAVYFSIFHKVHLPGLDYAIEQLEAENVKAGDELRQKRTRLLEAYKSGNLNTTKMDIEFINLAISYIQRENFLLPLACKGKKFTNPCRGLDDLGVVMMSILTRLGKDASAKSVWEEVKLLEKDSHPVIQEVEDSNIYWKTKKTGKEKTTPYNQFNNRLTMYRNKV